MVEIENKKRKKNAPDDGMFRFITKKNQINSPTKSTGVFLRLCFSAIMKI